MDIGNNELVTIYLLPEEQVQSEVIANVELSKNNTFAQITSFLSYLKLTTEAFYLVTALNTNIMIFINLIAGIQVGRIQVQQLKVFCLYFKKYNWILTCLFTSILAPVLVLVLKYEKMLLYLYLSTEKVLGIFT